MGKGIFITGLTALSVLFFSGCKHRADRSDATTVTISGKVTDFEGNPIDSSQVKLVYTDFSTAYETYTDKSGSYSLEVAKGRYAAMFAMRLHEYPRNNAVAEDAMRLEFWGWNFIADRDMEINPRYDRLELYGTTVFRTLGGYPGFFVYFRPMSVTKYVSYSKEIYLDKGAAEEVANISVKPEHLRVKVFADGEELRINSVQAVEEFGGEGNMTITGYVVQTDGPSVKTDKPYIIFRVEAENTEYGEKGKNLYFYEVPDFISK